MVERIEVSVTEEDIRNGFTNNCRYCPIANALRRMGYDPRVDGLDIVLIGEGSKDVCVSTPDVANEFIKRFDDMEPVKPFTFELEIPRQEATRG